MDKDISNLSPELSAQLNAARARYPPYTTLVVEHDGYRSVYATCNANPQAIIKAIKLKRRRSFERGKSRERTYLNVSAQDNWQLLGDAAAQVVNKLNLTGDVPHVVT